MVVVNHVGDLDPIFVGVASVPRRAQYAADARHFRHLPFARLLFASGRSRCGPRAPTPARCATRATSSAGGLIVVFAEGRPGWGSPMGEFLEGAGHLGLTPGVTVMPAAIWGVQHFMQGLATGRPRPGAGGVRAPGPGAQGRPPARARRRAHPPHAGRGGRAAGADDARPPVIAHAAPPPPSSRRRRSASAAPPCGAGRARSGSRCRPTGASPRGCGPRRARAGCPCRCRPGIHAVRVRAIGRGGARWSATVRVRALPPSALRPGRIPGFVDPACSATWSGWCRAPPRRPASTCST